MRGFTAGVVSVLGGVAVVTTVTGLSAVGCSASGSNDEVHGPAYGVDGGSASEDSGAADASLDASTSTLDGSSRDSTVFEPDSDAANSPVDSSSAADGKAEAAADANMAVDSGSCTQTTAVLGGNTISVFGAAAIGTGTLSVQTVTGSVTTIPALVPFNGGFQGLLTESGDAGGGNALASISLTGTTWSPLTLLGGNADAIDGPGLAAVGTTLQAAYLNPQHLYFHASFGAAWDMGADPVRLPNDAGAQAFGPVRAAAAGTATELIIVYEGSNSLPYAQTWTSAAGWDNGVALATSPVLLTASTPLAIAPISGTGGADLLAVYVDGEGSGSTNNLHLFAALRNRGTTSWQAPTEIGASILSPGGAAGAPSLTSLSGGRVLLAWQGQNGEAYTSVYTAGAATPWSAAATLSTMTIVGPPSVAPGVCGDDAEAAYVSSGSVYTSHFVGGAWSAPALLTGVAAAAFATIATSP